MDILADIAHTRFLPPYFNVVGRLLSLLSSENADLAEIIQLVASDQSLASRTLTMVNSSYYGLPRQIGRIDEAVIFLGLNELRNMVLAVAMHDISGGLRKEEWAHSLAVAHLAERLFRDRRGQLGVDKQKWIFAAGLMHDIGKLFLSRRYMEQYSQVLDQVEQGMPLVAAEIQIFGYDHGAVGGMMLDQWNIPELIVATVWYHHAPDENPPAQLVGLADRTARRLELPRQQAASQVEADCAIPWDELSAIVARAVEKSALFNSQKT